MAVCNNRPVSVHEAFDGLSNKIRCDAQNVVFSGNFDSTPQMNRQLQQLTHNVNHMQLDQDFLRSSEKWAEKFDPVKLAWEKQASTGRLQQTAGVVAGVGGAVHSDRVSGMMKSQVLDAQNQSQRGLHGAQQSLAPFASSSVDRIKQFCDEMGVTDRYTGYRNNLTRGSRDPVKIGYSWLDGSSGTQRPATTGHHTFREPTRHISVSAAPAVGSLSARGSRTYPANSRSLQERCGINTVFPGPTEYTTAYPRPRHRPVSQGYLVNPLPDYGMTGRPMATHLYEKHPSEYQHRYTVPDGSNMEIFPWLRK